MFQHENRESRIAEVPSIFWENAEYFPKDLETYYDNNLPLKQSLMFFNNYLNYKVFHYSSNPSIICGRDGWLFYNSSNIEGETINTISDYQGYPDFTAENKTTIINKLKRYRDICNQQNIPFHLMIIPNKEQVYEEYLPKGYGKITESARTPHLLKELQETNISVYYGKDTLMNAKTKDVVYYKTSFALRISA